MVPSKHRSCGAIDPRQWFWIDCSYSDELGKWMEVGNSGMFRPEMLRPMGLPEDVSVIAWGLSLERWQPLLCCTVLPCAVLPCTVLPCAALCCALLLLSRAVSQPVVLCLVKLGVVSLLASQHVWCIAYCPDSSFNTSCC